MVPFCEDIDFKQQLAKIKALKQSGQLTSQAIVPEPVVNVVPLQADNLRALAMMGDKKALHIEMAGQNYHEDDMIGLLVVIQQWVTMECGFVAAPANTGIGAVVETQLSSKTFLTSKHNWCCLSAWLSVAGC